MKPTQAVGSANARETSYTRILLFERNTQGPNAKRPTPQVCSGGRSRKNYFSRLTRGPAGLSQPFALEQGGVWVCILLEGGACLPHVLGGWARWCHSLLLPAAARRPSGCSPSFVDQPELRHI